MKTHCTPTNVSSSGVETNISVTDLSRKAVKRGSGYTAALVLGGLGLLAVLPVAQAQINIQDAQSAITYGTAAGGTATPFSAPFTVSQTSANTVLVFFYSDRDQGDSGSSSQGVPGVAGNGNPVPTWNTTSPTVTSTPMTLGNWYNDTTSTFDDNAIYYLVNPPAGTGTITGTTATKVTQYWLTACSITNVNTTVNPMVLVGQNGTTTGSILNCTVAGVAAGSWAAVTASASGTPDYPLTFTVSPPGGTVSTVTSSTTSTPADVGNAAETMGFIENLASGANVCTATSTGSGERMDVVAAVFTAIAPQAPVAPSWVSVTGGSSAEINLSWTASPGATSYILERSTTNGGPYTVSNVLSGTSYQDTQVLSGTKYYYVVAAANFAGMNTSVQNSFTPTGGPFPPLVGVGASGADSMKLHWTPTFGATSYAVLRATNSGGETAIGTTTNNFYLDTGLSNSTTYYYEVEAVGAGGSGGPSAEVSAIAMNCGWILFDNFSLDSVNSALNGATGSAGVGRGWTNLGGGVPINVANSSTFGGANYAQYANNSTANSGDYEAGLGIAGNSTVATVFMEFSLPGIQTNTAPVDIATTSSNVVAMNFDIDNSSPPGAVTFQSATGPSAQFNYDNTSGEGLFRVINQDTFYYVTLGPDSTPYFPVPGAVYYFWFVVNAQAGTYQIYLANGSVSGTNLDSGGLGAAPTLMWGTTSPTGTGSIITYGFRNVTAGASVGQPVDYIGTGPGSTPGSVPQNEFANIYVDRSSQNLTNPVTGLAPAGIPQVLVQAQTAEVFSGFTAVFTVVGSAGVTYQWESNGVALVNGGNVSGATTSTLTISNSVAADQASYSCIVGNPITGAFASSFPVALTIVTPSGAYDTAVKGASPSHYYPLNDTSNPSTGTAIAYDYAAGDNGTYGVNAQNGSDGITGPTPATGFSGFASSNLAAAFTAEYEPNSVTIGTPWNLNTNTVTMTAWINPSSIYQADEGNGAALVCNRGSGNDLEAFNYNTDGNFNLTYTWNNDTNTCNWDSGLQPPANEWSFVALVVTATNATISVMNENSYGMLFNTFNYPNVAAPFAGRTMIGDDAGYLTGTTAGERTFNGLMGDVAIYSQALSPSELQAMFLDGSGMAASAFLATNMVPSLTTNVYPGQTLQFSAGVGGSLPLTNVWRINGANLTDGLNAVGYISGSATSIITISNITTASVGHTYTLTLQTANGNGPAYESSSAITMNVIAPLTTTLNVNTYGANGSDTNDDYSAIASAVAAARSGDTVYFPNGTYYISGTIFPKSGITLTGQSPSGVILRPIGTTVNTMIAMDDLTGVEISNMTIDGYISTNVSDGIYAVNGGFHFLHNLIIENITGYNPNTTYGIHFNVTVTNCIISNNIVTNIAPATGARGITCSWGSSNNVITGNTITWVGSGGISADDSSTGLVITSNRISQVGLAGGNALGIEAWNGDDYAIIEDNVMDHWLSISGTSYCAVRRNIVSNSTEAVVGFIGLEMVNGTDVIFTSNTVNQGQEVGISLSSGPDQYVYWGYNTIQSMIQWGVQCQGDTGGAFCQYFYRNSFINTLLNDPRAVYPGNTGHGFRFNGASTNVALDSNLIVSNGGDGIQFSGGIDRISCVNNTIANNGSSGVTSYPSSATDLEWTGNSVTGNSGNTQPTSRGFSDQKPVASFSAPAFAVINQPVAFVNTSTAPSSPIGHVLWDFGDGLPCNTNSPTHIYARPGTYLVSLLVWDTYGRGARAGGSIIVVSSKINPTVSLGFNSSVQTAPEIVLQGNVGLHYQVLWCNALGAPNWPLLQDIPVMPSNSFTVYDPTPASATNQQRFYKAILIP